MSILKLKPGTKDYLWGGRRLIDEFFKEGEGNILAETWELSCHEDGLSYIENGEFKGKSLRDFINMKGKTVLGENCEKFDRFPILVKFIDAKDDLSIQVHPDDEYALKNEGEYGKTEMWYVVDAGENAFLYYGFKKKLSKEEFRESIENNTLLETLNKIYVKKGDVFFIEAGTIHAIGKDILVAEIQQNSNITYRVYDFARVGKDGRLRQLHTDKAVEVTNTDKTSYENKAYPHIASCKYFTVDKLYLDGKTLKSLRGEVDEKSFLNVLFLDGKGSITCGNEKLEFKKGDSFFISARSGDYLIEGECEALLTRV